MSRNKSPQLRAQRRTRGADGSKPTHTVAAAGALADIDGVVSRIRRFVNDPRKQHELIKQGPVWNKLCAAMDVVGDSEWALAAHDAGEHVSHASSSGMMYLAHYGFLQAAYVQQDAADVIRRSLGLPEFDRSKHPALVRIRLLRNKAVGHPAGGRFGAVHGIIRVTMRPDAFDLLSYSDEGDIEREGVDCRKVRQDQNAGVADILEEVVAVLEDDLRRHKDRFRDQALAPELQELGYLIGKVFETAHAMQGQSAVPLGHGIGSLVLEDIRDSVLRFRMRLEERGYEPGVLPGADVAFEAVAHSLARLRQLFGTEGGEMAGRDAEAFATHLDVHVKELIEFAEEIDVDYGSAPRPPPRDPGQVKITIAGVKRLRRRGKGRGGRTRA